MKIFSNLVERPPSSRDALLVCYFAVILLTCWSSSHAKDAKSSARFLRGLNLNGPQVTIDGNRWDGKNAKNYVCKDSAFDNQKVKLLPPTDADRAKMLRSSRYGGNRVVLSGLPNLRCTVFIYVWEDNSPETYTVSVNGRVVEKNYHSGPEGKWDRLGPIFIDVSNKQIVVTSQGGTANFSGIEIWRGEHDGHVAIPEEELAFFEKRIRPLLVAKCYECHSQKSDEVAGRLLVDSAPTLRRGGESGAAVVPGNNDASLLIKAVRYGNEDLQMPPDEKLSTTEIRDLEKWVRMGAPDPRYSATRIPRRTIDVAKAREFWSFRPVINPSAPTVRNATWPLNDIDRFILSKLEQHKLYAG